MMGNPFESPRGQSGTYVAFLARACPGSCSRHFPPRHPLTAGVRGDHVAVDAYRQVQPHPPLQRALRVDSRAENIANPPRAADDLRRYTEVLSRVTLTFATETQHADALPRFA